MAQVPSSQPLQHRSDFLFGQNARCLTTVDFVGPIITGYLPWWVRHFDVSPPVVREHCLMSAFYARFGSVTMRPQPRKHQSSPIEYRPTQIKAANKIQDVASLLR
jgi:hypothetical protein